MRILVIALLWLSVTSVTLSGEPYQKGYDTGSHPHCRHHCCDRGAGRNASRASTETRASGQLVEAIPVTTMVSLPVIAMRSAQLDLRATADTSRGACDGQEDRLDELDARIEALHLRLVTMQRSMEFQAEMLQELRDKGTIGGKSIGNFPKEDPKEDDAPEDPSEELASAKQVAKERLEAFKPYAAEDEKLLIEKVLELLAE